MPVRTQTHRKPKFFLVDVFAERKYAGNNLAVVELRRPIPTAEMQCIASEFNFPETTFVLRGVAESTGFRVRIFTPKTEVPFAGHPTLGTAHIILRHWARKGSDAVTLRLRAGDIPVNRDRNANILWMRPNAPVFGANHPAAATARLLGLRSQDLATGYPAREVSAGLPFLMVPLRSLDAVREARLDPAAYDGYFSAGPGLPVFLFCAGASRKGNHLHCRMFAPRFGIPEDPATGSATACLAGYILEHGFLPGNKLDLRVEQGYEMGRESLLHIRAARGKAGMDIQVGGGVVDVAEGYLS